MKVGLVALLLLSSVPVNAHESQRGYTTKRTCFKETYKEEYVAGTRESKGYVKSFTNRVEVPCNQMAKVHYTRPTYNSYRTHYYQPARTYKLSRSCPVSSSYRSSRATGGLLGGGLAAAVSRKNAWGWSIPLGAIIGLGIRDTNC